MMMSQPVEPRRDGSGIGAIAFAMVFPSLVTWLYFVVLSDSAAWLQQVAYGIGKVIQFAFPLGWVFLVQRERWSWPRAGWRAMPAGLLFGASVAAAMWLLYLFWLKTSPIFAAPAEAIRGKIAATGMGTTAAYLGLGVFYVVCHSLLEEYYWRWFVFRQLAARASFAVAALLSSAGFMAHHVILLAIYFGWNSPLTWLFSGSVAVGGAVWAWLFDRGESLLPPWFSHALVDAAIFSIGFDIVRGQLQG